jgi:hypothetical protein
MLLPGTFVNSIARGGVARDHRLAIVAILIFISLYKDHQKQFRDTCIKNEKVWGSYPLMGYAKTQIENKFKYLKARYIKKRDNEGNKGSGESPLSFHYYDEFDDIFGNHPNVKPMKCASSLKGCSVSVKSDTVFWLRALFKALNIITNNHKKFG